MIVPDDVGLYGNASSPTVSCDKSMIVPGKATRPDIEHEHWNRENCVNVTEKMIVDATNIYNILSVYVLVLMLNVSCNKLSVLFIYCSSLGNMTESS